MRASVFTLVCTSMLCFSEPAPSQDTNPLVGSWQRIQLTNRDGRKQQPPLPRAFLIFSNDGFYSQVAIPIHRSSSDRPLSQQTIKQLLARFENAEARYGRYAVVGNRVSRTLTAALEPDSREPQVQEFRIIGDTLILRSIVPGEKTEARFRRMR